MRLLLQLSLAAADDGAVLERADSCSSILSRRVLFVQRVVRRRRRAVRSRGLRHWFVWMLREHAVYATDANAIGCAHGTTHRVAYSNTNRAAYSDAEPGAHRKAKRFADGHTERDYL